MQSLVFGIILLVILAQVIENLIVILLLTVLSVATLQLDQKLKTVKYQLSQKTKKRKKGYVTPIVTSEQPAAVQAQEIAQVI